MFLRVENSEKMQFSVRTGPPTYGYKYLACYDLRTIHKLKVIRDGPADSEVAS